MAGDTFLGQEIQPHLPFVAARGFRLGSGLGTGEGEESYKRS